MKVGDQVRVIESVVVYHHPEHKSDPFDVKGLELQLVENKSCICHEGKLVIPKPLQRRATIWYHHLFDKACTEAELATYHTCSGFHADQATRQLCHEFEQRAAADGLAQHGLAVSVDAMHTEDVLDQIDTDGGDLSHDGLL